jgi:RNA recognition motif-containing protein
LWIGIRDLYIVQFAKFEPGTNLKEMAIRIFINNLSADVTDAELRKEFEASGTVTSVIILKSVDGRSLGRGFVEMLKSSEGRAAIKIINGKIIKDRTVSVNTLRDWSEFGQSPRHRQSKINKCNDNFETR